MLDDDKARFHVPSPCLGLDQRTEGLGDDKVRGDAARFQLDRVMETP